MKKATGNLSIHIFVDCPECGEQLDLFNDSDAGPVNEEGELWKVIDNRYINDVSNWDNVDMEVECQKCDKLFTFDKLEY